jgi:hypothetical protein
VLVLSSEMPGPWTLDSVQLLCGSDVYNHGVFLNARVYACHTAVSELDSAYETNYAGNKPAEAVARDTLYLRWKNGDWQSFGFDVPFSYNGTDNLILEFRWQGDNDSSAYNLGYYTSGNRALDAKSSVAESGTPRNYMPRFRIFYSTTGVAEGCVTLPTDGLALTATPNPFTAGTDISLRSEAGDETRVRIFDAGGRLVRILGQSPTGTRHWSFVHWDGCDGAGRRVQSGAYFCCPGDGRTVHLVLRD